MITNFFVLSPRGDTILAKNYRCKKDVGAHERSHTDAFFRRVKFWDEMSSKSSTGAAEDVIDSAVAKLDLPSSSSGGSPEEIDNDYAKNPRAKANAPPVFIMPDGLSYLHVKRNGLIFGCSASRNVSPITVIEVRIVCIYIFCTLHAVGNVEHDSW